ncbi:Miro domain-containing protein [Cylindrospermum sp. NIES-4074]|nr:Miro domain-containing protein [Cylindrospermum sp. NIES-4074]
MIQPKSLSEFSQLLNQETPPTLMWYPIWKYLSNWQESDEREQAVASATAYFQQYGETLNLGQAQTLIELEQRCKSLLFIAEQAREEELQHWFPDLLAAFTFYEEETPENLGENSDIGLHNRLETLLKKCASPKLIDTAQFIYLERPREREELENNPWGLHEDDYWMENYFLDFPEVEMNAFSLAGLLWTNEGLASFCLRETTLSLVEICRPLLSVEDGQGMLTLSGYADLEQLPTGFSQLKNLQALSLYLQGIKCLPSDIGQLTNLQWLYINMDKLEYLPVEIGRLSNLKQLILEMMDDLKDLPAEFSQLNSLEDIKMFYCGFMEVPEPIYEITNLKKLVVNAGSARYKKAHFLISPKIGHLRQLQELEIVGSFGHYLPDEIGELSALEKLTINCCYLEKIPESIGKLQHLKEMYCYRSDSITSIPDSLSQLTNLRILNLASLGTGHIPEVLFKMPFLQTLRFDSDAPQEEIERLKKALPNTEVSNHKKQRD